MKQLKDILLEKLLIHKSMDLDFNNLDILLNLDENGYTKIGHKRAKNKNGYIF